MHNYYHCMFLDTNVSSYHSTILFLLLRSNIDLVSLASAVFPTNGGGDTGDSGCQQGSEKSKGKSNYNSSSNNTPSSGSGNHGNNNNPPPPRNARDILHAVGAATSGVFPRV